MYSFIKTSGKRFSAVFPAGLVLAVWTFTLIVLPSDSQAQGIHNIKGKVTDQNGEEIPGVNILIKGIQKGTSSDHNGDFTLDLASKNETLQFSFIGYKTEEVRIGNQTQVSVSLTPDLQQLNEVVIVGYGQQERKNLIGSVTKVNPAETKHIPAGSFDAQLAGKVAGVQITSNTGVPGEAVNIRLRGATSINASNNPLYVLDGVFINGESPQTINTGGKATSPIADINPSDIESIEVLKDAEATALYGSRGANGVIIITTKRGKYNQKSKINFSASTGWAKASKLWDLTTGPEHATLVNELWNNQGKPFETRPFRSVTEGGRGLPEEQQTYDRLNQIFKTARLSAYDLSIAGGTENTRYYIGTGYNSQESILQPITFDRFSFKLNLDQKISEKIQIGVGNNIARTKRNQARAGDGPAGGLLQAALHTPTYLSPYNTAGDLVGRAGFDNVELLLKHYDVNSTSLRYIGNAYLEAELLTNLKFRSTIGLDFNNYNESEYWNTYLISGSPAGSATSAIGQYTTWINEQTLSYRKSLGNKHTFGLLLGNTLQSEVSSFTSATGTGFANNSFKQISSAAVTSASQDWGKNSLTSFFARADYNFAGKYLINFSLRADGSSKFGSDNRWGYFPSVGAAWRIKDEPFLENSSFLSDLKLRTSYGVTGNQNGIGNFASRGLWSGGSPYGGVAGTAPEQLANPNLKWEKTSQFNIGLDAGFFDGRLSLELNAYRKYTTDGLLLVTLPGTTGFNDYWSNAAEISNKGFEVSVHSNNIRKNNFSWTTNFNISRNINKIEKLETALQYGSRNLILQQEGHPLYSFWVYKQLYVDPQTGNTVYEDVNGDGNITTEDRQIDGSIWPKFFGGLTNNLKYKDFDIGLFFSFSYGNKVYNHNKFFGEGGGARDEARIIFKSNLERWQQPGDQTSLGKPDGVNVNNYRDGGSRWLEDGSFLRLRSLNIGYNVPTQSLGRLGIGSVRVFAQGSNLWTLTKYTGLDPESSANSSQNQQGIDLGTPPQPRAWQVGINVSF